MAEFTESSNIMNQNGEYSVSVAARVIYQLGEQLISDEFVALAELIKNGYDADCTLIDVLVDTEVMTDHGRGRIIIQDNGNGMTKNILANSFLRISSDFKRKNRYSPYFKRRALGEKGLGRLSIQRLGTHLTLITSPRLERLKDFLTEKDIKTSNNFNIFKLTIDWNAFKEETGDISSVKARISEEFSSEPYYGTKLIIEGIRNINFWKLDTRFKTTIRTEIFGMTNLFEQQVSKKFKIRMKVDNETFSNEKIDEEVLDLMSDVKLEFKLEDLNLDINILQRKRYRDRLIEKTITSMRKNGFEEYSKKMEYLDNSINISIDLSKPLPLDKFPYLHDIFLQQVSVYDKESKEFVRRIASPGNFKGVMYVSEQSPDALNEAVSLLSLNEKGIRTQKELKAIWKSAMGVYLFRNDFRIFPYGHHDFDWLGFTQRSQKEKNNIFKMHTVSGYIDIDSMTSENLMEQTNRLGLIEDEYGINFLTIIKDIITEIAFKFDVALREELNINHTELRDPNIKEVSTNDKNVIFYRTVQTNDEESTIDEINNVVQQISSSPLDKKTQEAIVTLKEGIDKLKKIDTEKKQRYKQETKTYEQQIIDLQSLIGLAGQGIIVESLTHELHRIENNIKEYAKESREIVSRDKDHYGDKAKILIENQDRILQEIIFLQQQLEHLEPTYAKNKLLLEEVNLKGLLQSLYLGAGPMAKKAQKANINVQIEGEDFSVKANKGILITIFDNLFINSLFWVKEGSEKSINFKLSAPERKIYVWDSGPGFHQEIVNIMFAPYKSMKKDGRGLGLYIVTELIRMLQGSISVDLNKRNQQGNAYILQISLN